LKPPSDAAPVIDPATGRLSQPWRAFFSALGGAAGPSQAVAPTGSPFIFTAPGPGSLAIQGTVSGLTLIRGRDPVALDPGIRLVPLAADDRLQISFAAAPGLVFLPS
jgi:hypothetical protein